MVDAKLPAVGTRTDLTGGTSAPATAAPSGEPRVERLAIVANMVIVPLCFATGRLSADLVQLYGVQTLGLTPAQVGMALGLLVLSVPAQLLAVRLPRRLGFRRTMRFGYAGVLLLLVLLAAVPDLDRWGRPAVFAAFVAVLLAIEVAISVSWGVAWHPWMRALVSPGRRPRFVARMQFATQLLNVVLLLGFGLLAGAVVDRTEYRILLAVLAVLLVVSITTLGRMPHTPVPDGTHPQALGELRAAATNLVADGPLRRLSVIFLLDTVLVTPLLAIYAVLHLGIPAGTVAVILAVRGLAAPISLLAWSRAAHRIGTYRLIVHTMAGTVLTRLLWVFVPTTEGGASGASVACFAVIVVVSAVCAAGYGNANLTTWYDAVPDRHSRAMFTLRDVIASSKLQLYSAAGGAVLAATATLGAASYGPIHVDAYKLLMLAGVPVAVAIAMLSRRAQAEGASR
ncbi:MFS transporter [Micromonospora andamanensis]|uniref:MFS transporter n=1 Tax=Micromonospora andamanensis TaxID=1287068 RepID=A0ABQ4I484_9ACTN|nr:MFS transporter [Micromonospora andamanensis]GIJ12697.1 hypothetical protein Van01_59110 [Micromonospora andamanensis]